MQLDWDNLRVFMELHREGTLAAAARALGMDATTVGRRVERLEETLGGKVFIRTPDGFELTDLGRHILASAEQVERHAIAVQRQATGEDARLEGNVRITCTAAFASHTIIPRLPALRARHPRIQIELLTGYQLADIARREADIALRVTAEGAQVPLAGGSADEIVARKVGRVAFGLYASQDYIERKGRVGYPPRLDGHDIIGRTAASESTGAARWLAEVGARARTTVRCDDMPAIAAAARAGLGVALMASFLTEQEPGLCRLDPGEALFRRTIWLLVHRDLHRVARIIAVSEFLAETFAELR